MHLYIVLDGQHDTAMVSITARMLCSAITGWRREAALCAPPQPNDLILLFTQDIRGEKLVPGISAMYACGVTLPRVGLARCQGLTLRPCGPVCPDPSAQAAAVFLKRVAPLIGSRYRVLAQRKSQEAAFGASHGLKTQHAKIRAIEGPLGIVPRRLHYSTWLLRNSVFRSIHLICAQSHVRRST